MRPPGVDRASSHSEFEASIGLPASDASPTFSLEGPAAPRASIEGGSSLVPFGLTAAGPTPSGEAATPSRKGPQAIDDVVTTIAGSSIRIGVLDDDLGKQLRVIWFDEPTGGSVSLKGNELVYTPDRGTERDSLRYIVMDANGTTDDALVLIGVIATRSSPVANPDTAITDVDTPVTIDVSSNDVDSDPGDTISIVSVTDPMHGTSTLGPGNTVIYTPDPGYTGADSFGYTARSGGSEKTGPDTATVFVNGPPDAVDDAATTNQEVAVVIPVLGNDSDPRRRRDRGGRGRRPQAASERHPDQQWRRDGHLHPRYRLLWQRFVHVHDCRSARPHGRRDGEGRRQLPSRRRSRRRLGE